MNPSPFHVGVSDHQNLGDTTTWQFVAQQFRELLTLYQQKRKKLNHYASIVVSGLHGKRPKSAITAEVQQMCEHMRKVFSQQPCINSLSIKLLCSSSILARRYSST
jgi:hypothetical protein